MEVITGASALPAIGQKLPLTFLGFRYFTRASHRTQENSLLNVYWFITKGYDVFLDRRSE